MIGQTLLHYQITEKLGEGGMGVVYKARDTHLDRFVAIKVLPPERVADPERKRRFVQEAKAASALNHPNIIVIHDISQAEVARASRPATPGGPEGPPHLIDFIVMEYVPGKTLDQLIPRKGMRLGEALKCAVQVADALSRAHTAGIFHRDVKPGNVMVDEHGLVKVLDFGLAKLAEGPVGQTISPAVQDQPTRTLKPETAEGAIVGTVGYMSPEQARGKPVDARSDIFSFGSLLYEMVSGRRAFRGDSNMSTLAAIINQEPAPLPMEVPHDLDKLITRCLRKDPARRFQHMDDVKIALEELKEESDSGKSAPAAGPPPKGRSWKWAAGGALALLLAAAAWIFREALVKPEAPLETSILTSLPGNTWDPALSPDGRQVAFSWNGENEAKQAIYLKLIGSPTPKRLSTGPGVDDSPAFSPDGLSIAFCRLTPGKLSLVLMPAIGGPERTLAEFPFPAIARRVAAPYFAWFPDGKTTAVVTARGLGIASLETGETRSLTTTAADFDVSPAVSPDGRRVAFVRTASALPGALYVLDLTEDFRPKGEPRRLSPAGFSALQPAWAPDGRSIVFVSGDRLWRVAASGSSAPRRLPLEDSGISSPAISRKGDRLVYRRSISNVNLWRTPLRGPDFERTPQKLIASTRSEGGAQYSPDGSRIAFFSSRTGRQGIWISDADGSNAVELFTPSEGTAGSPRWAPDGMGIAFDITVGGRPAIYTIAARGGKPARLETNVDGFIPSWSRDGAWIYFGSYRTGRAEVWKASGHGGPAQQVTSNGGFAAVESTDGKSLYYVKAYTGGLWKAPVGGREEAQILPSVFNRGFCVADAGMYFVPESADGSRAVQFLSFATGQVQVLASIGQPFSYGLSVSPDGRFALYPQVDVSRSELMLVENFR